MRRPKATAARGSLPHAEYLRLAMSHRFCLVAPGDFVSTHKITEAIALGAAGGCIPLFVIPARVGAGGMLPYTRWLDYCKLAYVISARTAASRMEAVVRTLLSISEREVDAKWAELRRARNAFVFRHNSSDARPSAAEHILSEACRAARRFRESGAGKALHGLSVRSGGSPRPDQRQVRGSSWGAMQPRRIEPLEDLRRCSLDPPDSPKLREGGHRHIGLTKTV